MRLQTFLAASAFTLGSSFLLVSSTPESSTLFESFERDLSSPFDLDLEPREPNGLNRRWALPMKTWTHRVGPKSRDRFFDKTGKPASGAIRLQRHSIPVRLAGKELNLYFQTVTDTTFLYRTRVAVEQPKWFYDPGQDPDAKFTGVALKLLTDNSTVEELSTGELQWGPTTIKAPSAYRLKRADPSGVAGKLGLGAPGGNNVPGTTLPPLLEQIRQQKLLDKDIYGLYYPSDGNNTLYIGQEIPTDLVEPPVYVPTSTQTRWAFEGTLNGQPVVASVDNTNDHLFGPIDVVKKIFEDLKLKTYYTDYDELYAFVDCDKGAKLTLDVAGLSMVFEGFDSVVPNNDEGTNCVSLLAGFEQGEDYPAPWTFGTYAMQAYAPILDYSHPEHLKIGFAKVKTAS